MTSGGMPTATLAALIFSLYHDGRTVQSSLSARVLCGRTGTRDIVDASVVLLARREGASVLSSDADDLHRLDPRLRVERILE